MAGANDGCAQCHDHKFDPITSRDFYSLGAFFADIKEPIIGRREDGLIVPDASQSRKLQQLESELANWKDKFERPRPELLAAWESEARRALAAESSSTPVPADEAAAEGGAKLKIQADGSVLVERGASPRGCILPRAAQTQRDRRDRRPYREHLRPMGSRRGPGRGRTAGLR